MKKMIMASMLALLFGFGKVEAQNPQPVPIEIGKWQSERDPKSHWEFKTDGKLYSTYVGSEVTFIYRYNITATPPECPDAQLSVEPNVKYLRIVNEADEDINCFYIYALNEKRLTVMDADTGHIFPSIRVED